MTLETLFQKAWKATGRQYGEDELENVELGWELHEQHAGRLSFEEAWRVTPRQYGKSELAKVRLGWELREETHVWIVVHHEEGSLVFTILEANSGARGLLVGPFVLERRKCSETATTDEVPHEDQHSSVTNIQEFKKKYGLNSVGLLVASFIRRAPAFEGDEALAKKLGIVVADLESALRDVRS